MTTHTRSPDVQAAVDLTDRIGLERWGQLTEGLFEPLHFLTQHDYELLIELQRWLPSRIGMSPTAVQQALLNIARVLGDFLLLFEYERDSRGQLLVLHRWDRQWLGHRGHAQEVERGDLHARLLCNLIAELTRAINLLISRARAFDPTVFAEERLAVCATGGRPPVAATAYYAHQARLPQPYPGLRLFPAVIESRDPGVLGRVGDARWRPEDYEAWIELVLKRLDAGEPSGLAPDVALASSSAAAGRRARSGSTASPPSVPGWITAVSAFVAAASAVVQILTAPAILLGSVCGGAVAIVAMYRVVWTWPPERRNIVAVIIAAALGGAIAHVIDEDPADSSTAPSGQRTTTNTPTRRSTTGQLAGGDNFLGVRTDGQLTDPVNVEAGHTVRVVLRLDNLGPGDVDEVRVRFVVPDVAVVTGALEATASSPYSNPARRSDTLTLHVNGAAAACLRVAPGSTRLDARHGAARRGMPEGIDRDGVAVGAVPVGSGPRYAEARVKAIAAPKGTPC